MAFDRERHSNVVAASPCIGVFFAAEGGSYGLAQGDFELALRGSLGEDAPLSAKSIERLRAKSVVDYEAWTTRSRLDELRAIVAASSISEPTRSSLLNSPDRARGRVSDAQVRALVRPPGAAGKLKSADRKLIGVVYRVHSLSGARRAPSALEAFLSASTAAMRQDIAVLLASL